MAEYIEREALKQSVRIMPRTTHPELVLYSSVQKVISDVPTADVVEVVRCKDCRHFGKNKEYRDTKLPFSFCDKFHHNIMTDNDFCSYGEKRSDTE